MLYFGNPSSPEVRAAMSGGVIGCIVTPRQGNRIPARAPWIADNGRFSSGGVGDDSPGWPGVPGYLAFLRKHAAWQSDCRFVIAPDQPYDMQATLELAGLWLPYLRRIGYRPAIALQNGAEDAELPWTDFDVACLGGDTSWKIGPAAAWLAREAHGRGKSVHMLRVNSLRRLRLAWGSLCDSCDGGFLRWPDRRFPELLRWLDDLERNGAQVLI